MIKKMPNPYEYSRSSVGGRGCQYSNLTNYSQNYFGRGRVMLPQLSSARSNQVVVVPSFGGPGYNALQTNTGQCFGGGVPSCTGFYSLKSAYPNFPNTCGAFSSRLCGP